MVEVEKNTLWKIQDCMELLNKRVNEEYVKEAISNLEIKVRKIVIN